MKRAGKNEKSGKRHVLVLVALTLSQGVRDTRKGWVLERGSTFLRKGGKKATLMYARSIRSPN